MRPNVERQLNRPLVLQDCALALLLCPLFSTRIIRLSQSECIGRVIRCAETYEDKETLTAEDLWDSQWTACYTQQAGEVPKTTLNCAVGWRHSPSADCDSSLSAAFFRDFAQDTWPQTLSVLTNSAARRQHASQPEDSPHYQVDGGPNVTLCTEDKVTRCFRPQPLCTPTRPLDHSQSSTSTKHLDPIFWVGSSQQQSLNFVSPEESSNLCPDVFETSHQARSLNQAYPGVRLRRRRPPL